MPNTKTAMDDLVEDFNGYIDSGDLTSAQKALVKISVHLATLPSTTQVQWGRTISTCRSMLNELIAASSDNRPTYVLSKRSKT